MPRTIVYPPRRVAGGQVAAAGETGDPYTEKVAKYVPAEVLGFFLPATVLANNNNILLLACFIVGLIGTPLYLFTTSSGQPDEKKPRPHFYFLALIAFAAWAVGTSGITARFFGLDTNAATFVLAVAVFLIPGLDQLVTKFLIDRGW